MKKEITITRDEFIEALAKATIKTKTGIESIDDLITGIGGAITNKVAIALFGEPNIRDACEMTESSLANLDNPLSKMFAESKLASLKAKAVKDGFATWDNEEEGTLIWNEEALASGKKPKKATPKTKTKKSTAKKK